MEGATTYECGLNLKATELRLGLPGMEIIQKQKCSTVGTKKRAFVDESRDDCGSNGVSSSRAAKQQVVGWPPVRSCMRNSLQQKKIDNLRSSGSGEYIKVSMDGAPYLRKVDLKMYKGYPELLKALMEMFIFTIEIQNGSEYVAIYEDKEEDWMLVGDVPFEMFVESCKRLRIVKSSEAKGLASGL